MTRLSDEEFRAVRKRVIDEKGWFNECLLPEPTFNLYECRQRGHCLLPDLI